jgi:hypothetical protein
MAFMVCISANAQQGFEDGIYQMRQATSMKLTNEEYNAIKDFALKSGNTFHFEYEPTMYAKGVRNQRIGYNVLLYSNIAYAVANGFTWAMTSSIIDTEQAYKTTIISTYIVCALDIVSACYISIGQRQKNKSAIAISPSGVRITF